MLVFYGMSKQIIVLAKTEMTGMRPTGTFHRPDGVNWQAKFEVIPEGKALRYSSEVNAARLAQAKAFAKEEGYKVYLMADTDDVLALARARVLSDL